MNSATSPIASVPYATPVTQRVTPWAGAAIIFGGVALILMGGCFMIGAMTTINGEGFGGRLPPSSLTGPQIFFVGTMYLLAIACFVGAGVMLTAGTRALLRLMGV